MSISRSHIIDQEAQKVFRDALPSSWLIREQKPDFHIDYYVELEKASEPSGIIFGVQLKGTESLQRSNGHVKQTIKAKHLAYYIDRVRQPVFIVVVDVVSRQGYWLFIQEWIRRQLISNDWRSKNSVTVRIPIDNKLRDIEKLIVAVTKAERYMRDLWPGSIGASISNKKAELEILDPRFSVDIKYEQNTTIYSLLPKETVNGYLLFSHPNRDELSNKLADLFERGLPVNFRRSEIHLTGTQLLEKLLDDFSPQEVVIETCRKARCEFSISSSNAQKEEKLLLSGIEGQMTGGSREMRIEAILHKSPLVIRATLALTSGDIAHSVTGNISISFVPQQWVGQHLLQLSYFDAVSNVFAAMQSNETLSLICEINGNRLFSSVPDFDDTQTFLSQVMFLITVLQKARHVAQRLKINPVLLPYDNFFEKDYETIELLWTILTNGSARPITKDSKVSVTLLPSPEFKAAIDDHSLTGKAWVFRITKLNIEFLGCRIHDFCLVYQFTNWSLSSESRKSIEALVGTAFLDPILLSWEATDDSGLIISLGKHKAGSPTFMVRRSDSTA